MRKKRKGRYKAGSYEGDSDFVTGIAVRLKWEGFFVTITNTSKSFVYMAHCSFFQELYNGWTIVEGSITAFFCAGSIADEIMANGDIPVTIDAIERCTGLLLPDALAESNIIAKRNTNANISDCNIVVAPA